MLCPDILKTIGEFYIKPPRKLKSWISIENIDWYGLSRSIVDAAIELLKDNPEKNDWYQLSCNPNIFEIDQVKYKQMLRDFSKVKISNISR